MILDFNKLVKGSSLLLPAHPSSKTFGSLRGRRTGWGKGNIFFGGAFCEAKNEIRRRKSEGRNPERGGKRKLYNLAAGLGILRLRLRITFLYFLYEKIT